MTDPSTHAERSSALSPAVLRRIGAVLLLLGAGVIFAGAYAGYRGGASDLLTGIGIALGMLMPVAGALALAVDEPADSFHRTGRGVLGVGLGMLLPSAAIFAGSFAAETLQGAVDCGSEMCGISAYFLVVFYGFPGAALTLLGGLMVILARQKRSAPMQPEHPSTETPPVRE